MTDNITCINITYYNVIVQTYYNVTPWTAREEQAKKNKKQKTLEHSEDSDNLAVRDYRLLITNTPAYKK